MEEISNTQFGQCPDCGVFLGQFHQPGCKFARPKDAKPVELLAWCPKCGHELDVIEKN
jgi:ssDNA-binding Zn-finger/Zn-ribbon topoisomerase 1